MSKRSQKEQKWLIRQLEPFQRFHIISFVFIAIASLTALLNPLIMRWLIDEVLPRKQWQLLPVAALAFFTAYLIQIASYWIAALETFRAVQRMMFSIRVKLLDQLQRLSADYHDRTSSGDTLFRLEQDVEQLGELCGDIIPSSARMLLMVFLSFGAMLFLNTKLTCLVLPLVPIFVFVHHHYQSTLLSRAESVQHLSGKRSALLHELLPAIVQVQLLGRERRQTRRFAQIAATASRAAMQRELTAMRFSVASVAIVISGMTLILGYGGREVMIGALTIGGLVAFYSYLASMFGPLSGAVQLYSRFQRVMASIRRIREIEDCFPSVRSEPGSQLLPERVLGKISFRHIWFSYDLSAAALNDLTLDVEPGERIAIVGPTGSGKSTIGKLLVRMYEAKRGSILVDGWDVRDLELKSLRSAVALVPQSPILFSGSIRENLLLGKLNASPSQLQRVLAIVQLASSSDVADRLLNSVCEQLSGGEKQRVSLARALLQGRPIMVLDEATSALDPRTEDSFLQALKEHYRSTTILAISHREATAKWADRVVVINSGTINEQGTHDQLMRDSQSYRHLWRGDQGNRSAPVRLFCDNSNSLEDNYAANP